MQDNLPEFSSTDFANNKPSLTDSERDGFLETLTRDGYAYLPCRLPKHMISKAIEYTDAHSSRHWSRNKEETDFSQNNIVEQDSVFREMLMFKPALQLSYDMFGPMFHLGQDVLRAHRQVVGSEKPWTIGWHTDGPRNFPQLLDGRVPCHTLRFGYFLSDTQHDNSGTLEVIRGSHLRPVLLKKVGRRYTFDPVTHEKFLQEQDFSTNREILRGEIVAFHNALWHCSKANQSAQIRKICYFQYCPTFMHPLHRQLPYPDDMSQFTDEERWILGEPRPPQSWNVGSENDWQRMARFKQGV